MIYEKLFNLQKEFETLTKSENNPFFKSKYLPLEDILKHFVPLLNKCKILCYHYSKDDLIITRLQDYEDKESYIESEFKLLNSDPQKRGSEITYGRRYNLGQLLNINAEDDDGNLASSLGNTKKFYKEPAKNEKQVFKITNENIEGIRAKMLNQKLTPEEVLKTMETKFTLSEEDKQKILNLF